MMVCLAVLSVASLPALAGWTCYSLTDGADPVRPAAVWSYNADCAYAIGYSGVQTPASYVFQWDGVDWSRVFGPETDLRFLDVAGTSPENVFITGRSPTGVFAYHWDGSSWTVAQDVFGDGLYRNHARIHIAVDHCVIIAVSNRITIFSGGTWQTLPDPGVDHLLDVWGFSVQNIHTVGGEAEYGPHGTTYTRHWCHWNGSEWSVSTTSQEPLVTVWGLENGQLFTSTQRMIFQVVLPEGDLNPMPCSFRGDDYCTYDRLAGHAFLNLFITGDKGASHPSVLVARWDGNIWRELPVNCTVSGDSYGYDIAQGVDGSLVIAMTDYLAWWDGKEDYPTGVSIYHPEMGRTGDSFYVYAYLNNSGDTPEQVRVFFALEIFSQYWFWDDWSHFNPETGEGIDYVIADIPSGTVFEPIVPMFTWPECIGYITGLYFHSVMIDSASSALLGDLTSSEWGYNCN